jgi:tight adherence protein B
VIAIAVLCLVSAAAVQVARRATDASSVVRRLRHDPPPARWRAIVDDGVARLLRARRDRQLELALPDALDAVARSLRSGASMRQAVAEAAEAVRGLLRADLDAVARDVGDGASLEHALERWCERRPLPGVRLAAAALALGAETGGASARAIDGVTATLRTNLAIAGEVRALSSQARLSALVIVLAPIAFAFLATTSDGSSAAFLLGTPLGWLCLAVGLGLDAIGWLWMRRVTEVVA